MGFHSKSGQSTFGLLFFQKVGRESQEPNLGGSIAFVLSCDGAFVSEPQELTDAFRLGDWLPTLQAYQANPALSVSSFTSAPANSTGLFFVALGTPQLPGCHQKTIESFCGESFHLRVISDDKSCLLRKPSGVNCKKARCSIMPFLLLARNRKIRRSTCFTSLSNKDALPPSSDKSPLYVQT